MVSRLKAWIRSLLVEHVAPGRLAAAVFVGTVVGCTPLFGLHFPICVALALLFGLNKLVVYGAANISVPPLIPLLGFMSAQLGERLLGGRWLTLRLGDFRADYRLFIGRFFVDWLVGGLLVGVLAGAVLAAIVYQIARRRRPADPIAQTIRRASALYRAVPRPLRVYAWMKYRLDPCYRAIAAAIDERTMTVDLGTGLAMLPAVLALLPGERRVIGVEWDGAKLAAARSACAGLDRVELVGGDLRAFELPTCDAITLVDVLHYYAPEAQRELMAKCVRALAPGGRILIREADRALGLGARWTRAVERLAVRQGWNRGEGRPTFRTLADLRADLETLGLSVTHRPVTGRLHPGNVLLVGELRSRLSPASSPRRT